MHKQINITDNFYNTKYNLDLDKMRLIIYYKPYWFTISLQS